MNKFEEDMVYLSQNENKLAMCDGCLSSDRLLTPVGKLRDLFYRIMSHDDKDGILCVSNLWQSEPHLCWECSKVLLNTHRLQQRVYEAQKSLHLAMPAAGCAILSIQCNSLSTLTGCIKETIDYEIISDENEELLINDMTVDNYASNEPGAYSNNVEDFGTYFGNDVICVASDNDDVVDDYVDVIMIPKKAKKTKKNKPGRKKKKMPIDRSVYSIITIDKEEYDRMMLIKKDTSSYKSSEFTCDLCIKGFRRMDLLDKHNKDFHDPNHTLDCDVCPVKCSSDTSLKKHQKKHVYYKCNMCKHRNKTLVNIGKHFAGAHAKAFKCCDCGMEFTNKSELGEHARDMHKGYECDHCGKVCEQKSALVSHINRIHTQVKCKICSRICANKKAEKVHYKLKHEKKSKERFDCVECKMVFDTAARYMDHVTYHHVLTYECKSCRKNFKTKTYLQQHINYHHKNKYEFICKECDKHFVRKDSLERHVLRIHRNVKPNQPKNHVCDHCSRAFLKPRDLVHHVRTHTGARPHACALCAARFAQVSPLVTHLRGVHGRKGGFRELLNKYMQADSDTSDDKDSDDEYHDSEDD